jgi:hypothetical protein
LYVNGKLVERRKPDVSRMSTDLKHAPFAFKVDRFQAGTLKAVGYLGGRKVTSHERRTPGRVDRLSLRFDLSGRPFATDGKDAVFCHAELLDRSGTVVPNGEFPVFFGTTGHAKLAGQNPIALEAGVATVLLESDTTGPAGAVYALSLIPDGDQTRIVSAAASPNGKKANDYTVHLTTDGTEPTAASAKYRKPIASSANLRAAIVVKGKVVAQTHPAALAASTP